MLVLLRYTKKRFYVKQTLITLHLWMFIIGYIHALKSYQEEKISYHLNMRSLAFNEVVSISIYFMTK